MQDRSALPRQRLRSAALGYMVARAAASVATPLPVLLALSEVLGKHAAGDELLFAPAGLGWVEVLEHAAGRLSAALGWAQVLFLVAAACVLWRLDRLLAALSHTRSRATLDRLTARVALWLVGIVSTALVAWLSWTLAGLVEGLVPEGGDERWQAVARAGFCLPGLFLALLLHITFQVAQVYVEPSATAFSVLTSAVAAAGAAVFRAKRVWLGTWLGLRTVAVAALWSAHQLSVALVNHSPLGAGGALVLAVAGALGVGLVDVAWWAVVARRTNRASAARPPRG